MTDIKKLQKELETLDVSYSECAKIIMSIDEDIHQVDRSIKEFELRRQNLQTKRDTEASKGESLLRRISELKKQIELLQSGEGLLKAMQGLIGDFLASLPPSELSVIDESLASYKPVMLQELEDSDDDLPWNDAPIGDQDDGVPLGGQSERVYPDWLAATGVDMSGDTPKMLMMNLKIVGEFFRAARRERAKHFEFVIHFDDKQWRVCDEMLTPASMATGVRCDSHTERARQLYTLAFRYWLEEQYGTISARDMFDYLVGCDCVEMDGKYVPNFKTGRSVPRWYRLQAPDGSTILEVEGGCDEKQMYVAYTDLEGYRVIAKFIGFTEFEKVAPDMFPAYFPWRQFFKHKMERCRDINFEEIFKDAYFTIEEVH